MSLSVIIPDETKMTIPKFKDMAETLIKFITSNSKQNIKEIEKIKTKISEISGYLIAADKKKFPQYFTAFNDLKILNIFNALLNLDISDISFCILEAVNFLLLNLKNKDLILNIYKTKFKTKIQGQIMNILDKLMGLNLEGKDEFLNHQINFMKSLSLKFDNDNIFYFFYKEVNQFQMLTKSFSMYNNSDPMVRNVVKNILLSIIKIKNEDLENFLVAFPINIYYTNLVLNFKNYILQLCLIDLSEIYNDKIFGIFRKKHDELIDISMYLGDILDLGIKPINFMLINCLLNEIILPLFKVIISRNKETANISIALYIFTIIIYNMKNKDIVSIICYLLFEEYVSQGLLKYIYDYSFKFMSVDYMSKINYIIENCQLADVNDKQWKDISVYMKFVNGIDLSTREVHNQNTYDTIKSVVKNENNKNLIKNEIYNLTKSILNSNNEYNIMLYNLLIVSLIKFYSDESKLNSEEEKILYNPLSLPFFTKDINSIDNPNGLFQYLIKLIHSENNFRISTYEIILYNIQTLINIFLTKINNNNTEENPEIKTKIKEILINVYEYQIKKIKKLFNTNKHLWKSSYESMKTAYEQYVKAIDKKINDLITLPSVLCPVQYTNFFEEIPKNLIQNLSPPQVLTSNFLVLMLLHDILCKIVNKEKDMIKSQRFPLETKFKKFGLKKNFKKEELGDNYAFCKIIDEIGSQNSSLIILTGDTLYLAEIPSGDFKDISNVVINKKILMRYLEIKVSLKNEEIIEIADNSFEKSNMKYFVIHCLNADNTGRMFNYLSKQKKNCLQMEFSMVNSFLDSLENKFNVIDIPEEKHEENIEIKNGEKHDINQGEKNIEVINEEKPDENLVEKKDVKNMEKKDDIKPDENIEKNIEINTEEKTNENPEKDIKKKIEENIEEKPDEDIEKIIEDNIKQNIEEKNKEKFDEDIEKIIEENLNINAELESEENKKIDNEEKPEEIKNIPEIKTEEEHEENEKDL